MSLPQYRQSDLDDESVPLVSAPEYHNDDKETTDPSPVYPPHASRLEQRSGGSPSPPETIAIAQRGFPSLACFPQDRIELYVPIPIPIPVPGQLVPDSSNDNAINQVQVTKSWVRVMDEGWSTFEYNPPSRLAVQISDGLGDYEARKAHEEEIAEKEVETAATVCLSILALIGFVVFVIWLLGAIV
ncbi:hypothetical protein CI109_102234 [Kwoniella shandongensis]|uniref:Uncharacterized protein n=1 Tax=Kwoniella shandongensis TaxID=1734106 RepID=A0A5M6BYM7_9TREE|nr:uncharacterized protein CI109_003612 [Kwoniella shandongensis]KAA5527958.1 hypothetical protein CI109_003612 [Kwoniella shandongensis]